MPRFRSPFLPSSLQTGQAGWPCIRLSSITNLSLLTGTAMMVLQMACLTKQLALLSIPRTCHMTIAFARSFYIAQSVRVMNIHCPVAATATLTSVCSSSMDAPTLRNAVTCRPTRLRKRLGILRHCSFCRSEREPFGTLGPQKVTIQRDGRHPWLLHIECLTACLWIKAATVFHHSSYRLTMFLSQVV